MEPSGSGTVATAGTPVALTTETIPGPVLLTVQALKGNTGRLALGLTKAANVKAASNGTEKGLQMDAGESFTVRVYALNQVFLDVSVNGEGYTYIFSSV